MKPYQEMEFHPDSEKVVQILCDKTQSDNPKFFRIMVAYFFTLAASHMRVSISSLDRGEIPINMYAMNMSPSGTGKGFSTNILEDEIMGLFRERFMTETFPYLAEINLPVIAQKRAARKATDPEEELEKLQKEFERIGPMLFSFDSATTAAVKQLRHKLLLAKAGAVNLQIDEFGSNLLGNADVLSAFLELYDKGKIKQKLTKNTQDNLRNEEVNGSTPTNMLLFGTPSKVLDGAKTEEELTSMLEAGYARRCFFGYCKEIKKTLDLSPEEVFDRMTNNASNSFIQSLSERLYHLADPVNANKSLPISRDNSILLVKYKQDCERRAQSLGNHQEIEKAEISHRYFKAMKLAGTYAFIDNAVEVEEKHIYYAIKLAEESGESFLNFMNRERPYIKLAKYFAEIKHDVTHADLVEDLPFYRGSASAKHEMLQLAIAYGYKNNILIKRTVSDGIEFFKGESLEDANLDECIVSYSNDIVRNYLNEIPAFDKLYKLTQVNGLHWVAHHLRDGYRDEDHAIPGFNLVILDIDDGTPISTAKVLLDKYKFLLYTTKSHTEQENCYRIILPIPYILRLDAKDYKEFMSNIYEWLPFKVDTATGQRARKWLSNAGHYEYHEGELLDVLPFIPKTSKNEERKQQVSSLQSLDNLERWIVSQASNGSRNNILHRYAMVLVDTGKDFGTIQQKIFELNNKLPDKLEESEILSTIMVTVGKAIAQRQGTK